MAKQYISLQGKFYLAEIANGVAAAMRHLGSVPEFELEIGADLVEHQGKYQRSTHNRFHDGENYICQL